jgi:hypothetical protein
LGGGFALGDLDGDEGDDEADEVVELGMLGREYTMMEVAYVVESIGYKSKGSSVETDRDLCSEETEGDGDDGT